MDIFKTLKEELKYEIIGISLLSVAVICVISFYNASLGAVGNFIGRLLAGLFGYGRIAFPLLIGMFGLRLIVMRKPSPVSVKAHGAALLFLITLTVLDLIMDVSSTFTGMMGNAVSGNGGGVIGALIYYVLRQCFGLTGTYIILITITLVAVLLLTNVSLTVLLQKFWINTLTKYKGLKNKLADFLFEEEAANQPEVIGEPEQNTIPPTTLFIDQAIDQAKCMAHEQPPLTAERVSREMKDAPPVINLGKVNLINDQAPEIAEQLSLSDFSGYKLPPVSILSRPVHAKNVTGVKDINDCVRTLEDTLESFGIRAKVTSVSRGPAITRYEIHPPAGVKVSRIVGLADDIALAMAAPDVRIEAPIPGKAAMGIEVPNKEISMVHLRELLESREFIYSASRLTVALGKDIAGTPIVADLAKMPHLLIAGATGAGKSVCLNTLISSILFKALPEEVKFLMIDPKMVELAIFNGIPHLISPVVTNSKKAATSLRWVVKEMENRYELFAQAGVRDITRYNSLFKPGEAGVEKRLPFMLVIIDELADLMMVAPADVEDAICRLAQMARAAGIHLVVATQRPSVDVITGLIKANIPSRISFAVSSQVDSRTILDMSGAEKLLGKGDMLFFPVGYPKPLRVQGAYLSDKEVDQVVSYLKKQAGPTYNEQVTKDDRKEEIGPNMEDELLPQAVEILIETGHASISMLQRRLHIGYARAARLIDIMERREIVGGYEGNKPRPILMTMEQYQQVFKHNTKS